MLLVCNATFIRVIVDKAVNSIVSLIFTFDKDVNNVANFLVTVDKAVESFIALHVTAYRLVSNFVAFHVTADRAVSSFTCLSTLYRALRSSPSPVWNATSLAETDRIAVGSFVASKVTVSKVLHIFMPLAWNSTSLHANICIVTIFIW